MKKFARFYYIFFGVVDLIATGTAFILSLNVLTFYFSYFTVLSNILIIYIFLQSAYSNRKNVSVVFAKLNGAAVLYMTITGVIYWSILVNQHSLSLDPWINLTMHGVTPIAALLSWILFSPKQKLQSKTALYWLIPPSIFAAYTLVRGQFIQWYPYPFLNPITSGGYTNVLINITLLLFGAWVIGLVLVWISNSKFNK